MEAYVLFPRGEMEMISCDEQEEDIGCPSESELSLESSLSEEEEVGAEIADDASSSGSSSAGHFEMSSLVSELPLMRRGLSKFFDGKSQSFTSLAAVGGLEDLAKPTTMRKRLKTSRSCGAVRLQDEHRRGRLSGRRFHNASTASFKKASGRGQLSVLGASRRTRPSVTAVSPSPRPRGAVSKTCCARGCANLSQV
ncbi:hypothetical protein GUJ93_ZPchr0014g46719 [Zizania palustris]|uniref:Uncharacterized protein n=1 Tax=Zizania palustris TaxID=103762 RepID=A0A8J5TLC9_ZIZPA|nr:hypothetical protein GUJ93_ZPchr0014g46719 [Zizania palustris]